MSVGKNIKKFRKQAGLTQVELANKANISRSYLGDVENERYNVSLEVLGKIAKALNIDMSSLIKGNESFVSDTPAVYRTALEKDEVIKEIIFSLQSITDDEGNFLKDLRKSIFYSIVDHLWMAPAFHNSSDANEYENQFREYFADPMNISYLYKDDLEQEFNEVYNYRTVKSVLLDNDSDQLELFLDSIKSLITIHNINTPSANQIKVPLLGSISAGQPIDRIEYIEGYELIESETLRGRTAYCLKVKGDSMIGDGIYNGDTVVVVQQQEVTSSDIAVVSVNGEEATLKRIKCEGEMCILMPSNPTMQPQLVPAKSIQILGKVIQSRRNFE
ncbi:helix-turn-helix domain-containing protein [Cytobacillus oceanisediminis]|uniref:helix-turn-helix domain-containing protein n=1 Tax=Cytobacillus oceanisediminis TaxID=665099 RepID=UPI002041C57A|nr:LexA family transcriptional regulator [Cytobacillus oceanisediminis]MCM3242729.1 helix-turn-helix domain-containing protein [Cytobacillus oceanisediminis]